MNNNEKRERNIRSAKDETMQNSSSFSAQSKLTALSQTITRSLGSGKINVP